MKKGKVERVSIVVTFGNIPGEMHGGFSGGICERNFKGMAKENLMEKFKTNFCGFIVEDSLYKFFG